MNNGAKDNTDADADADTITNTNTHADNDIDGQDDDVYSDIFVLIFQ